MVCLSSFLTKRTSDCQITCGERSSHALERSWSWTIESIGYTEHRDRQRHHLSTDTDMSTAISTSAGINGCNENDGLVQRGFDSSHREMWCVERSEDPLLPWFLSTLRHPRQSTHRLDKKLRTLRDLSFARGYFLDIPIWRDDRERCNDSIRIFVG